MEYQSLDESKPSALVFSHSERRPHTVIGKRERSEWPHPLGRSSDSQNSEDLGEDQEDSILYNPNQSISKRSLVFDDSPRS